MNYRYMPLWFVVFNLIAANASAAPITSAHTGAWYDPAFDKQGFNFEVLDRTDGTQGKKLLAFWYSYDDDGNAIWATGVANIEGEKVTLVMSKGEGGSPSAPSSQAPADLQDWAEVDVQFSGCNTGTISFASSKIQAGTGTFNIKRLSSISARSCSGGISDDVDPDDPPVTEIGVLTPPGSDFAGASGRLDFQQFPGQVELEVEVEDLPAADYSLFFAAKQVGVITVVMQSSGGTRGKLVFRSPADSDSILLDFDPLQGTFEVRDATGAVALSGELGNSNSDPGSGMNPPPPGGTLPSEPPPFGDSETEVELDNNGIIASGEGRARLEQRPDRVDFDVEIEKVPVGDYTLQIGGAMVWTITVRDFGAGITQGDLEFRFPVKSGKQPLNFDPRGALIEILQGGNLILSGTL